MHGYTCFHVLVASLLMVDQCSCTRRHGLPVRSECTLTTGHIPCATDPLPAEQYRLFFGEADVVEWRRREQELAQARCFVGSSTRSDTELEQERTFCLRRLLNSKLHARLPLEGEISVDTARSLQLRTGLFGTESPFHVLYASAIGYFCLQPHCIHPRLDPGARMQNAANLSQLFDAVDPGCRVRNQFHASRHTSWLERLRNGQPGEMRRALRELRRARLEKDLLEIRQRLYAVFRVIFDAPHRPSARYEYEYSLAVSELIPLADGIAPGGYCGRTDEALGAEPFSKTPRGRRQNVTIGVFEDKRLAAYDPSEERVDPDTPVDTFYKRSNPENEHSSNVPAELLGSLRGTGARFSMVMSPRKAVVLFPHPDKPAETTLIYPPVEFSGTGTVQRHRKIHPLPTRATPRVLHREDGEEVTTHNEWLSILALAWLVASEAQRELDELEESESESDSAVSLQAAPVSLDGSWRGHQSDSAHRSQPESQPSPPSDLGDPDWNLNMTGNPCIPDDFEVSECGWRADWSGDSVVLDELIRDPKLNGCFPPRACTPPSEMT